MSLYVVPKSISLLKDKILLGQKEEFKNKLSNLNIGTFSVPSQGITLGELLLTNWRAVSAKGVSEAFILFVFLLLFQSAKLVVNCTQGVTLG